MSKRTKIISGTVTAVIVLAVVAALLWWFQRDEAPEAVDLETAVAQVEAAATDDSDIDPAASEDASAPTAASDDSTDVGTASSTDAGDTAAAGTDEAGTVLADSSAGDTGTETTSADQTADAPAGLAGVWTVETAEGAGDLSGEPAVSFAGFRVDEVLGGGIGDFTAVGRTADVAGSIELSDTALVAATVEVQMGTLRTDNSNRDGRMRQALNTNEFPLATFTLVESVALPAGSAGGEPFSGPAEGDLTIKGVTNRVTFSLEAQLVGDKIVVVGSSEVVFSDYGVSAPSAPIVVSVEDNGIMEFQLLFTR